MQDSIKIIALYLGDLDLETLSSSYSQSGPKISRYFSVKASRREKVSDLNGRASRFLSKNSEVPINFQLVYYNDRGRKQIIPFHKDFLVNNLYAVTNNDLIEEVTVCPIIGFRLLFMTPLVHNKILSVRSNIDNILFDIQRTLRNKPTYESTEKLEEYFEDIYITLGTLDYDSASKLVEALKSYDLSDFKFTYSEISKLFYTIGLYRCQPCAVKYSNAWMGHEKWYKQNIKNIYRGADDTLNQISARKIEKKK